MKRFGMDDIGMFRFCELATIFFNALYDYDSDLAMECAHDDAGATIEELKFLRDRLTNDDFKERDWDRTCPVCGKIYSEYPALSRRDNKNIYLPGMWHGRSYGRRLWR